MSPPRAMILGCAGAALAPEERDFFRDADPLGFILFQRNCVDPDQLHRLVEALRESVGRADAPVLIDQEGGRVARLRPPHWRSYPSAARIAALGEGAAAAAREVTRLIADDLVRLGITVDCLPVLDLPVPGADAILGDRAYGTTPERAGALASGCDLVLHCNGRLDEMRAVAGAVGALSPEAAVRVAAGEARRRASAAPFDRAAAEARLDSWFGAA